MKPLRRFHFERLELRALLAAHGDFNGDGFDDLAVGTPKENSNAGAVQIIYGTSSKLAAANNQTWSLDSPGVNGVAHTNEFFGSALAVGDFNGDGFDDLAIGIEGKVVNMH